MESAGFCQGSEENYFCLVIFSAPQYAAGTSKLVFIYYFFKLLLSEAKCDEINTTTLLVQTIYPVLTDNKNTTNTGSNWESKSCENLVRNIAKTAKNCKNNANVDNSYNTINIKTVYI